jgi:UDP:flavonoid glycosyltransferase YjiC (YdhE family)
VPRLFVAVTAHGYGHLAQVAPVVSEIKRRLPALEISLQGNVSPAFAKARLPAGFRHLQSAADVPLPMDGPLTTRWADGLADYVAFDLDYAAQQRQQRRLFDEIRPDLVLADIPWLPLDVARSMGIPCAGLCSLSWYDILVESPVGHQLPAPLTARMQRAYSGADLFLRPAPSMPMSWLPNGRDIGPIAQPHRRDPRRLRERIGRLDSEQLVLMQFGGTGCLKLGGAPRIRNGLHLLSPDADAGLGRDDLTVIDAEGGSLLAVLASSDALITKPGYGTFVEAACSGIPVLSVERRDWPESRWLVDWLADKVPMREISVSDFAAGKIDGPLSELLAEGPAEPVAPTGVAEAADLLLDLLAQNA